MSISLIKSYFVHDLCVRVCAHARAREELRSNACVGEDDSKGAGLGGGGIKATVVTWGRFK